MKINKDSVSYDFYEEIAEYHLNKVDEKPILKYYERPSLLSLLPDVSSMNVLDAGCGSGWYTNYLLENNAKVTAIDYSKQMLEMTKKRVGDKVVLKQHDLNENLDFFEDNALDLILASLSLHYIKDWNRLMIDFYRILKEDGYMIFSTHHPILEYQNSTSKDYFSVELLSDKWTVNNEIIEVSYYRRPLNETFKSILLAGFSIEDILEPMPSEELRDLDPKEYEHLASGPRFLFMKCKKA